MPGDRDRSPSGQVERQDEIEETLASIVDEQCRAQKNAVTVNTVRTEAEERLGMASGFFKGHSFWNRRSKEIIMEFWVRTPPRSGRSPLTPHHRTGTSAENPLGPKGPRPNRRPLENRTPQRNGSRPNVTTVSRRNG